MFLFGRSADRSSQENRRQILDYDDIHMLLMQLATYLPDGRTSLRLAIVQSTLHIIPDVISERNTSNKIARSIFHRVISGISSIAQYRIKALAIVSVYSMT